MRECNYNVNTKIRSFLNVKNKKLNFTSILGAILGIVIAVSSIGIYISKNTIYTVKVNNKEIGYVRQPEIYEEVISSIAKTDGIEVTKNITLKGTSKTSSTFLTAKEIERFARRELKLKMPGVIMYADGLEIARLGSVGDVTRVMDGLKEYYALSLKAKSYTIISNNIKEKITTYDSLMDAEEILDVDETIQKILNGHGTEKTYVVKNGDTIWDIAIKNNMTVEQIKIANQNLNIDKIHIGEKIKFEVNQPYMNVEMVLDVKTTEAIPFETKLTYDKNKAKGYKKVSQQGKVGKAQVEKKVVLLNGDIKEENIINSSVVVAAVPEKVTLGSKKPVYNMVASTGRFGWPTRGLITSRYGRRWGRLHTGIDIGVSRGTSVAAADNGVVSFAGWYGSYGKCIIINHGNGYQTLYAHLSSISVNSGRRVSKGQRIGLSGNTGRSTGPHLHFEVRRNGSPQNPSRYLR